MFLVYDSLIKSSFSLAREKEFVANLFLFFQTADLSTTT